MPYIPEERRRVLDPLIDHLITAAGTDGERNYVITQFLMKSIGLINYMTIQRMMGLIECVKQEIYRRVAAPYEDKKREENGDVF